MPKKYTVLHIYFHFEPMGRKRKPVDQTTYAGRFALRLRTLREAKHFTPEELAEETGVSVGSIWAWERADNTPPVEVLPKLAEALGTTPRMLLPEEDEVLKTKKPKKKK